jgi:hypothetical protein
MMNRALLQRQMFANGGRVIPDDAKGLQALASERPDVVKKMGFKPMQEGGLAGLMQQQDMAAMPMGSPPMDQPPMAAQGGVDPNILATTLSNVAEDTGDLEQAPDFQSMMNQFSGEDKSEEERRDDLASIVGPEDAAQTPDSVLALVTPVVQISMAEEGIAPMARDAMDTPVEGDMAGGIMSMTGAGNEPPENFKLGGEVRRRGDEDPVQYFAPENKNRVAGITLADLLKGITGDQNLGAPEVPTLQEAFADKKDVYRGILGDTEEQKKLTQAQILFDIANTALAFAAPMEGEKPGLSAAERLAMAATKTKLAPTIAARAGKLTEDKRKFDLAALQSAEAEVTAAKKAEQAFNLAKIKNRTKPKATTIYSPDGTPIPVVEKIINNEIYRYDSAGKLVDFTQGTYKDHTLVKPDKVEKKSVELFEKGTNKSLLGVESDGEFYTDNTLTKKLDKKLYTKKSSTDVKSETFYLEDRTPIPLKVVNGEYIHAVDVTVGDKNYKAGEKFDTGNANYANGSFDKPDKQAAKFGKPKWFMKSILDKDLVEKYGNNQLEGDELVRMNNSISAFLAGDRTVNVGGTVTVSEPMLPPSLKEAILKRFKNKQTIPDAATVYLQNRENVFDAGMIATINKLFDKDKIQSDGGKHEFPAVNVDNIESIFLSGENEPQLLEAQGLASGVKKFFEDIKANILGEISGSIKIYEVTEARSLLKALALRTLELQSGLFAGNRLKIVTERLVEQSEDISGGAFTSDSDLYNALTKNRKALGVILRTYTDVLKNKKQFRAIDVVSARKGAKQVLNLLGEYTAFINLIEKQSSDKQNISKLQTENKIKSKLFDKLKKQNK